jgi:hypothetical protein
VRLSVRASSSSFLASKSKFLEPLATKLHLKSDHTISTGTSTSDRDPLSLLQLESESEASSSRIPTGSVLGVIFLDSLISPTFLRSRTDEDPTPNFTMLKMIVKSIANELVPVYQRLPLVHIAAVVCCIADCSIVLRKNQQNEPTHWMVEQTERP